MDSLIAAAARALAAGDPLAAMKLVALRDDPLALALRGIAMAQLGDFARARALLRRAARTFGPNEVVVACQQACASNSIVFGDINNPNSEISKRYRADRSYGLLAEIGTRPRTRFLGKIRNPNPEMKTVKA